MASTQKKPVKVNKRFISTVIGLLKRKNKRELFISAVIYRFILKKLPIYK